MGVLGSVFAGEGLRQNGLRFVQQTEPDMSTGGQYGQTSQNGGIDPLDPRGSRVKRSERAGPGYLSRAHQLLDRSTAVQHGDGVTEPIGMDGPEELGSCPP